MYVDDFIINGDNEFEVNKVVQHLNQEFIIKELGELNYFLGIEVKRKSNSKIIPSQRKYILEVLIKSKMDQANSLPTPMVSNLHLYKYRGEVICNERQYRSIVGAL